MYPAIIAIITTTIPIDGYSQGDSVGCGVGVGEGDGVGDGLGEGRGEGLCVGEGDGDGLGVGLGDGVGGGGCVADLSRRTTHSNIFQNVAGLAYDFSRPISVDGQFTQ